MSAFKINPAFHIFMEPHSGNWREMSKKDKEGKRQSVSAVRMTLCMWRDRETETGDEILGTSAYSSAVFSEFFNNTTAVLVSGLSINTSKRHTFLKHLWKS